jgi:hypothetical protein
LLKRIQTTIRYDDYFSNASLASDWDVCNEIVISLRSMDHAPELQHIKSHQDKHKSYHRLPLKARLNCDADALADNFLAMWEGQRDFTRVPMFPHAGAQIHLSTGTITGKLKRPIVEASRGPDLIKCIVHAENWSDTTPALVDWLSHGVAVRNTPHQLTMIKMIHGLLPTAERTNKYDPKYNPNCPTCKDEIEDNDHLFHCSTPCRKKWRAKFTTTLRKKAEKLNTRPNLILIMVEGAMQFLQGRHSYDPQEVPAKYRELVKQQNKIGWLNFLRGRWSLEWTRLQHKHHQPKSDGDTWASQLIRTIWDQFFEMWLQRNRDLHGEEAAEQYAAERLVFHREITQLYDSKEEYPITVQHIFSTPLDTLLSKRNNQLHNWLATWRPVLDSDDESSLDSTV